MKNVRNVAVAGAGVWAGWMVAGAIAPMLPKDSSGATNVWVDRIARFGITGAVVILALKTLGTRKG